MTLRPGSRVQLIARIWNVGRRGCCRGEWRDADNVVAVGEIIDRETDLAAAHPRSVLDRVIGEEVDQGERIDCDGLIDGNGNGNSADDFGKSVPLSLYNVPTRLSIKPTSQFLCRHSKAMVSTFLGVFATHRPPLGKAPS